MKQKKQIFAVFKRFSVCSHIQICIKSKLIIHHTKSIVCQTNLLMTTLGLSWNILLPFLFTQKRPLGFEYFHNEIVILVNVSLCLLGRTCCWRGWCGGWHSPPRSRCVTCLVMLSADWAEVTEDVSVSSSLCPLASWPRLWFTSESGAFIADSRWQTAATHREITFSQF